MAASVSSQDYFGSATARNKPLETTTAGGTVSSPRSPRTPLLGRSVSSQYGSPSTFRAEQEDVLVYELGARHFSAGYAGESRPRCILPFTPDSGRRVGDYREHDAAYIEEIRRLAKASKRTSDYELYTTDLSSLDLGLVEDKLDRMLRTAQTDYLQIDAKARKVVLAVPSLLPSPLLEVALKVLFAHFTQPPSISILTSPILCCVSAGLRNALVMDIGWEETVVTAVAEYKEVMQRRSVRAGKLLVHEMTDTIKQAAATQERGDVPEFPVTLEDAEDLTQRMAWCRPSSKTDDSIDDKSTVVLPIFSSNPPVNVSIPFAKLANPAEQAFFAPQVAATDHDDHELPLHVLAYRVLLHLPLDLRTVCLSRIIITGGVSRLPGIKRRLLCELNRVVETHDWDPVWNYGSVAGKRRNTLQECSVNIGVAPRAPDEDLSSVAFSPTKMPLQDDTPHGDRVHDDVQDPITLRAEQEATRSQEKTARGVVRGVETLGAWAGASLIASLRVKGTYEVEREDFLKHGLRDGPRLM